MPGEKKRELTESENALWKKVVRHIEEIEPQLQGQAPKSADQIINADRTPPSGHKPFRIGQTSGSRQKPEQILSFAAPQSETSPNMDRRNFKRLLKGKIEIDGTLDLHGLTADQARTQLQMFVQNAHKTGARLLLVVTGKGKQFGRDEFNRPKSGVLKQGVPEWLASSTLSPMVLQVAQAHIRHGGGGACYVYLRRKR